MLAGRSVLARRVRLLAAVGLLVLLSAIAGLASHAQPREHIVVDSSYANVDAQGLKRAADAVVVVEFLGHTKMFWNSSDNKPWEPEIGNGIRAWIYRDDQFRVLRTLYGNAPGAEVVVRGIGGTVDNVTMDYDGQVDWQEGETYLLFLRLDNTPFENGWERVWTVVWTGHGSFKHISNGWQNETKTVDLADASLDALMTR